MQGRRAEAFVPMAIDPAQLCEARPSLLQQFSGPKTGVRSMSNRMTFATVRLASFAVAVAVVFALATPVLMLAAQVAA
jgi:hypothetical protein